MSSSYFLLYMLLLGHQFLIAIIYRFSSYKPTNQHSGFSACVVDTSGPDPKIARPGKFIEENQLK